MTEPLDVGKMLHQRLALLGTDKVFYPPALMALFDCTHIAYPDLEIAIESFDDWSRYLSEPLRAEELKPFLKNPKNKPFYRQFEGGKKWKF